MKNLILLSSAFLIGCAQGPVSEQVANNREPASTMNKHETIFPHPHQHKSGCGHKTETSGMDTYYLHDGEKHMLHAGHVDKK